MFPVCDFPYASSHYYTKLRDCVIDSAACYLGHSHTIPYEARIYYISFLLISLMFVFQILVFIWLNLIPSILLWLLVLAYLYLPICSLRVHFITMLITRYFKLV